MNVSKRFMTTNQNLSQKLLSHTYDFYNKMVCQPLKMSHRHQPLQLTNIHVILFIRHKLLYGETHGRHIVFFFFLNVALYFFFTNYSCNPSQTCLCTASKPSIQSIREFFSSPYTYVHEVSVCTEYFFFFEERNKNDKIELRLRE